MTLIKLAGIEKEYGEGEHRQVVLRDIHVSVENGEMVAIMGQSGSGKSTLMHVMGLLDKPTRGEYLFNQVSMLGQGDDAMATLRNQTMGFVFQQFYLLPRLTALENVALPLSYRRLPPAECSETAKHVLQQVGLSERMHHRPNQLSGGQQQRVAIARALVGKPAVIFADEPTGALDSATGDDIMALFKSLHEKEGATIVIVTHDPLVAKACSRCIQLRDGRVIS